MVFYSIFGVHFSLFWFFKIECLVFFYANSVQLISPSFFLFLSATLFRVCLEM
jgi:hypothetical protein